MFIFIPVSSLSLAKFFCFCKCIPFLCYTLVLSLLFFGVGFEFTLASFWGYLKLISCALVCFIEPLEPARMRSGRFFIYPLNELLEI